MKHELLLNGRDTTIDASFFIDNLDIDRETVVTDEFGKVRTVEFRYETKPYLAYWRTNETVVHIVPMGKGTVKKFGGSSLNLLRMAVKLKKTDFDGLGVKVTIGLDELDFKPELRISFYEEI